MKYAFSTLPCMEASAEQLITFCKNHAISGIEIRTDKQNNICGKETLDDIKKMGATLKENDVAVVCLGTGVCLLDYEIEKIKLAKSMVDKACAIHSGGIRIFLGNFGARTDAVKRPYLESGIVKAIQELCDYNKDINIMVETHNEFATGKVLKSLAEQVSRENLKFIWDIIHPIEDGESIQDTWNYIGPYISNVNIKDGKNRKDPIFHDYYYTKLGEGELPLFEVVQLLTKNNFEGMLSLEWENTWRKELQEYPEEMDWILSHFQQAMQFSK